MDGRILPESRLLWNAELSSADVERLNIFPSHLGFEGEGPFKNRPMTEREQGTQITWHSH